MAARREIEFPFWPASCGLIVALALVVALAPIVMSVARTLGSADATQHLGSLTDVATLLRTLGYPALIGAIAVALAAPSAWLMRRARVWTTAALVTPMFMPAYLAYAGWSLARAPGTMFGDWLARGPGWVEQFASRGLAVTGLALWAWPIAAIVLWLGARRIDDRELDVARGLGAGALRRFALVARRMLGAGLCAWAAAAMLTAGSAVPLHLAQIETVAIRLWRLLVETPNADAVWLASWPTGVVALAGGVFAGLAASRLVGASRGAVETGAARGGSVTSGALAALVWLASVAAPIALFAWSLREPGEYTAFWRESGGAVWQSAQTAGLVGMSACALALAVFGLVDGLLTSGRTRAAVFASGALVGAWAALTLAPGVMIGLAISRAWAQVGVDLDSPAWSTLARTAAHLTRYGLVAVVVGVVSAAAVADDARAVRRQLAGLSLAGFARAVLAARVAAFVGAGVIMAMLSMHEIEATVQLTRPGERSLSQVMLEYLHYAQDDRLSAASVQLMTIGTVVAFAGAWLVQRGWARGGRPDEM